MHPRKQNRYDIVDPPLRVADFRRFKNFHTFPHEGKIEIRKVLPLSLSFDHRVVDGAESIRFMNTVIDLLQDPGLILMEE